MSALEEYRKECEVLHLHKLPPAWVTIGMADAAIAELEKELAAVKAGYGSLPKLRRVRDELAEENEAQRLRIAELEAVNTRYLQRLNEYASESSEDRWKYRKRVEQAEARIAELEHILHQTTGQREYAATKRAEQAEAELAALEQAIRYHIQYDLGPMTRDEEDRRLASFHDRAKERSG